MASMTGQQIFENFASAPGSSGLESARIQLDEIRQEYELLAEEITRAAGALEEHWQGDAAGAAQRGAGPLALVHKQAGTEMSIADRLLDNQISEFNVTKNSVKPVPPVPERPSGIKEFLFGTPPSYLLATTAANDAAQHNVTVMDNWTKTSGDNGSRMPVSYGKIDPGAFSVTQGSTSETPGAIGGFPGAPEQRKRSGGAYEPRQTSAPRQPGPGESTVDPPKQPAPVTRGDDQTTRPVEDHPKPNPVRTPAMDVPRPPVGPPPGGGNPTWLPPGTPITGPGVPGTGRVGGPGAGRIAAPGAGGSGNIAGRLGGGQGSGAAGPRGVVEPGVRGAAGSAGKAGAGGMAPGAAGQRGKGGEDEEHQRKYVLDDDSPFLPSEKGEKIVDPTTGMSPTPPVIGK